MTDSRGPNSELVHALHPPLVDYYEAPDARRNWLRHTFDATAGDYDRMERMLGFGSGSWHRRQALLRAGLQRGMKIIDVGVGTGLVAREAAAVVGDPSLVTGVDPSPGMLQHAIVPAGVKLVEGSAEDLRFPDASFDFLSMGYALRHISDLTVAAREFSRVLRPGGLVSIIEITRPESRVGTLVLKAFMRGVVPTIARFAARSAETPKLWRYYWDTIESCVPPAGVLATLRDAGFERVERVVEFGIFSEYRARKPT